MTRKPHRNITGLCLVMLATLTASLPVLADEYDRDHREHRRDDRGGDRGDYRREHREYYNHYYYGNERPRYVSPPPAEYYVAPVPPPVIDFTFPLVFRR